MKVCDVVINTIWYDPRVRKQIIEYLKNGVEVYCVGANAGRYDEDKIKEIPCEKTIVDIDPRYKGYQKSIFRKLKRESLLNKAVEDAIVYAKPDVIHANDLNALIPAFKAAKKLKCKIIYDSHEVYVENNNIVTKKLYSKILKIIESYMVKRIDKMVCVSHAAAEYFEKTYNIEKPMVVTNCSLKSEQSISDNKNPGFEIINHGQFYEGRGYDIMVETIPLLKDYPEIKLAIRGFGKMEEQLRKRAEELGGDNFIFYPKVLVNELIPKASSSHVGVAITEGICINFKVSVSNKLFEYASAGLPVIMSDIPEHRYLNEKYKFGIVLEDNTPETFAKAVIKLYTDKDFYLQCAENAKKLSDEVNWENEFGRLIEFERSCLEDGK